MTLPSLPANTMRMSRPELGSGIDFTELVQIFLRRLGLMAAVGLTVGGFVFVWLLTSAPLYKGTALLMVRPGEHAVVKGGDVGAASPGELTFSPYVDSQVEILSSEGLAEKLVDRLQLTKDKRWNPRAKKVVGTDTAGKARLTRDRQRVIRAVHKRIQVKRRDLTYVIAVSVEAPTSKQAAQMANALAELYLEDRIRARAEFVEKADEWLGGRIASMKEDVIAKESAEANFKSQTGLIQTGGQFLIDQNITALEASIITAQTDLSEKEAQASEARRMLAQGASVASFPFALNSEVIRELRAREADIARRQSEMERVMLDRHPDLVRVRSERQDIRRQIQDELARIAEGLTQEARVAQARLNSLRATADQVKAQMAAKNSSYVQLGDLARDATAARGVYEGLLSRRQEISEQRSLPLADAELVEFAKPPMKKSSPKGSLALLAGLAVGALAGLGAGLVREVTEDVFNSNADVRAKIGLPLLAMTPDVGRGPHEELIDPADTIISKPMSPFAESMRLIRANLLFDREASSPPKVIAVTSALPHEGKTSCSLSLARMTALGGHSVILLDCDLRRNMLSQRFPGEKGAKAVCLEQVLLQGADWRDAVRRDPNGVHLIANGGAANTPMSAFTSERCAALVRELSQHYDMVILDCPPVLPVAETLAIASLAQRCLMVTVWAKTPTQAVVSACERLAGAGIRVSGVILNRVDHRRIGRLNKYDSDYYLSRYSGVYLSA